MIKSQYYIDMYINNNYGELFNLFHDEHMKSINDLMLLDKKLIDKSIGNLIAVAKEYFFSIRVNKFGVKVFYLVARNTFKVKLMVLFDITSIVFQESLRGFVS